MEDKYRLPKYSERGHLWPNGLLFCIILYNQSCAYGKYTFYIQILRKADDHPSERGKKTVPVAEILRHHHQTICRKFGRVGTDTETHQIAAA